MLGTQGHRQRCQRQVALCPPHICTGPKTRHDLKDTPTPTLVLSGLRLSPQHSGAKAKIPRLSHGNFHRTTPGTTVTLGQMREKPDSRDKRKRTESRTRGSCVGTPSPALQCPYMCEVFACHVCYSLKHYLQFVTGAGYTGEYTQKCKQIRPLHCHQCYDRLVQSTVGHRKAITTSSGLGCQ